MTQMASHGTDVIIRVTGMSHRGDRQIVLNAVVLGVVPRSVRVIKASIGYSFPAQGSNLGPPLSRGLVQELNPDRRARRPGYLPLNQETLRPLHLPVFVSFMLPQFLLQIPILQLFEVTRQPTK